MKSLYQWAQVVHLFCAIIFAGGVFFEMLILSAMHGRQVSHGARREVAQAISRRATQVMPAVVFGVFASGLVMVWTRYTDLLKTPLVSAFGIQLSLKILTAVSVLAHFVIAVTKMRRQTMTAAWSKYIHAVVFCHMLLLVLLAKTMFFVSW